jgi:hypothetical protein
MTHQKMVDGVLIDLTPQEQSERDAENATWNAGENNRKAAEVRAERNERIAVCDWRVLPDVLNGDVWKVYRQALRDVPNQAGFPGNVVWPVEP